MSHKQMFQLTTGIILVAIIMSCNIPLRKQNQQNDILEFSITGLHVFLKSKISHY